ncbi:acyl-CoA dehydrogenase family protein [candidate division KSB1 bacterium]|nr:acyl-CoA dehydrogenase family protein [candidate division KSB1 bacterium]
MTKTGQGGAFLLKEMDPQDVLTPEDFNDEIKMIKQTTDEYVDNEIQPVLERLEKLEPGLNQTLLRKAGELGLIAVEIPEKYGGSDLSKLAATVVSERVSGSGGFSTTIGSHMTIGTLPIVYFGTEDQKARYLPKLATAELIGAYGLTEPGSGSDALGAKTMAKLTADGKHYILNGSKIFISNGGFADIFIIFAKVDGERKKFSAFIVERSYQGFSSGAEEKKMGIKASSTTPLTLENVKVPVENLLGNVGDGAKIAFNILNIGRFKLGAGCVGGAKKGLEKAAKYAQEREQFGVPISSFGMIQGKLAEMALRTFAVESAVYRAIGYIDDRIDNRKGDYDYELEAIEEFAVECSMSKVLGSELVDFVADETVQVHGGYGYTQDYGVERLYRDSRINRIFEGTNEINRMLIPGRLLKNAMNGSLPLFETIERVTKEIAAGKFDTNGDQSLLAAEKQAIANLKKCTLLILGAAAQKYEKTLKNEQELLGCLADMMMAIYASESACLRALKSQNKDMVTAAQIYVNDAVEQGAIWARTALSRFKKGEDLDQGLGMVRKLTQHPPIDTVGLRRELAQAVLKENGYPFEY